MFPMIFQMMKILRKKERRISDFLFRVAATTEVDEKTLRKIAESVKKNAVRDWKPDDPIEVGEVIPKFNTWNDFISDTTEKERLAWCSSKASFSNKKRLLAGIPVQKIMASDVWKVLEAAKGKCFYCGSWVVLPIPQGILHINIVAYFLSQVRLQINFPFLTFGNPYIPQCHGWC